MSLPFRTYAQSETLIGYLTANKVDSATINALYNLAYRSLVESYEWSARRGEIVLGTADPYSTGTVSVTQGSTTVTGSGTTWTSAMTGRFIRINDEDVFYKFTYVGATSGTLETAWVADDVSGASYEIFGLRYSVDTTDGEIAQILLPNADWPIERRSTRWLDTVDPARRSSGTSTPLVYVLHGLDSDGSQLIEFWPRPSAATAIRIPYYKRIDDISGSTKPILRSDLIEAQTLAFAFAHLDAKHGDPRYGPLTAKWEAKFEKLLEEARTEDLERHGLPRSVAEAVERAVDHEYLTTHDID